MRATTKFLLLGAFAMCLSACLPEPPMGSQAPIFKRSSRYGWGGPGQRPGNEPPPPPAPQQQPRNSNRFGHSDNSGSGSGSSRSQNSGSPSNSRSSGDSRTPDSTSRPGDSNSSNSGSGNTNSNSGGGGSDNKMTDSGGGSSNSAGNSSVGSANTPPSNLNSYPYARLVPGKKGYVTLPGANASVGEVDVTGIKPGTAVEIDDPRDPSKKIYFRVP